MCNFRETNRAVILLIAVFSLTACGAGKAAIDAGKNFDRYSCMSQNFKGKIPCPASSSPADQP